jgi:hypothetical protein
MPIGFTMNQILHFSSNTKCKTLITCQFSDILCKRLKIQLEPNQTELRFEQTYYYEKGNINNLAHMLPKLLLLS